MPRNRNKKTPKATTPLEPPVPTRVQTDTENDALTIARFTLLQQIKQDQTSLCRDLSTDFTYTKIRLLRARAVAQKLMENTTTKSSVSPKPDSTASTDNIADNRKSAESNSEAQAELSTAIDELLDMVGSKFNTLSKNILQQMDDMASRLDDLEAQVLSNQEPQRARDSGS